MTSDDDDPIRVDFRDPATARTWIEDTRIKRPGSTRAGGSTAATRPGATAAGAIGHSGGRVDVWTFVTPAVTRVRGDL
jgi:hypothetical protein